MPTKIKEVRIGELVFDEILKADDWVSIVEIQAAVEKIRPGTSQRMVQNCLHHLRKSGLLRAWRPNPNKNNGPGWQGYRYRPRPYLEEHFRV